MDLPQRSNRFVQVFQNRHVVLPVIHTCFEEQAQGNIIIAKEAGADGVFLINHSIDLDELLEIQAKMVVQFPDLWIGVNCLGDEPLEIFSRITPLI